MKFTGIAISLAFAGVVSSAALPPVGLPNMSGPEGAIGKLEGQAGSIITGAVKRQTQGIMDTVSDVTNSLHGVKRQLQYLQPITESVASSMNGGTGVVGSAVGTVETTVGGAAGTAENSVTGVLGGNHSLLQLESRLATNDFSSCQAPDAQWRREGRGPLARG